MVFNGICGMIIAQSIHNKPAWNFAGVRKAEREKTEMVTRRGQAALKMSQI